MKRQLNPKKNGSLCDGHFSVKDCRWSLKEAICLMGKYYFRKKGGYVHMQKLSCPF